ncbi:hypothetical protein AB0B25_22735 [Nocardia sp. NPDC049190]|uniref:hypothetical protein n=1 Tax=Nocardia sp. NPDC049190 TaxID=3155650 RepID=UPI0033F4E9DA
MPETWSGPGTEEETGATEPTEKNGLRANSETTGHGAASAGHQAAAGLAAMVGHRLPGQCEHCDAEGEVVPDAGNARLFHLRIYHADPCPVLRAHSNRRRRRRN